MAVSSDAKELVAVRESMTGVVLFHAPWSSPSQTMVSALSEIARALDCYIIDVDEESDLAGEFGITVVPAFVFLRRGQIHHIVLGTNRAALEHYANDLRV